MPQTYIDLDLNMSENPITGDISLSTGSNAVIRSVANLCEMNYYEYPFHPDIGANLTKLLFENFSSTVSQAITQEITNTINNYEPRASLSSVAVSADPTNNQYNVTVTFFIQGSATPVTVNAFLTRVR